MNIYIRICIGSCFFWGMMACNNQPSANKNAMLTPADTAKYYPIASFVADEIKYVDLRNFAITEKNSTSADSVIRVMTKDEFLTAASPIITLSQWFMANKQLFAESVFQDLGTESYTINYSSTTADIKSIDLLLNQQTNLPKRLFIRVIKQLNDTTLTEQYSWIANKQFVISHSKRTKNGFNKTSSREISWKNQDLK